MLTSPAKRAQGQEVSVVQASCVLLAPSLPASHLTWSKNSRFPSARLLARRRSREAVFRRLFLV